MKKQYFYRILIAFNLFIPFLCYGQEKTITLSTSLSGTQDIVARDAVILNPGFNYSASGGYTFTASIDESLICDVDYLTGDVVPNPSNRSLNTSYEVGSTAGAFNVTASGAASYTIPIIVPPGTAGIQPSLRINYNSNGGYGLLGKGWSLSGQPAIYRVPSTYYHDGSVDPVDYDSNDAFIMDGMRLIKDGTVYKTEIEGYSTITPTYSGSAITKFTVKTKNGQTIEYGATTDSKETNIDGTRYFAWHVSKISDAYGNYMEYVYENDINNGFRLAKINYTGNTAASLNPYNTIYFLYEKREDSEISYVYGKELKHNLLLRKIRCDVDGIAAHTYNFKYIMNTETLLSEVIEGGSDNSRLNSTAFSYYGYGSTVEDIEQVLESNSLDLLKYGDFNGDGRTDLFAQDGSYLRIYTMNDDGTDFSLACSLSASFTNLVVGDFNGDNLADVVLAQSSGSIRYYKSTGTSLTYVAASGKTLSSVSKLEAKDINGDFIDDLVVAKTISGTNNVYIFHGNKTTPFSSNFYFTLNWGDVYFHDVDGDGKNELWNIDNNNLYIYNIASSSVNSIHHQVNLHGTYPTRYALGDYNGDGKTDYVCGYDDGTNINSVRIAISKGNGFKTVNIDDLPPGVMYAFDNDADDKDELFVYDPNSIPISPWDGSIDPELYVYKRYKFDGEELSIAGSRWLNVNAEQYDFNGDNVTEYIFFHNDKYWVNYKYKGGKKNKLYQIADGLNNRTIIEYNTINNNSVHTPSISQETYPLANFNGARYVVSKVQQSDGIGGTFENAYTYEGAKYFKQLNMFLGFSSINKTSTETGITSITENTYHGTYPYTSKTKSKTYKGSNNISSSVRQNIISHIANKRIKYYPQYTASYNYLDAVGDSSVFTFDSNGNITQKTNFIGNSGTSTTYYESYTTVAGSPVANVPQTIRTVNQRGNKAAFERRVNINYNSTTGFVNYKIMDPDESKPLRIDYTAVSSGLGLVWKEKVSGTDISDRTTEYTWGDKGRFVVQVKSPEGQVTKSHYDALTGNVLLTESPTGYNDKYAYDGLGRLTYNKSSGASTSLHWYSGSLANCIYYAQITGDDIPEQYVYYDRLGRVLTTKTQAYETVKTIVTNKSYNGKGQLTWASAPFFENGTEYKTVYDYDDYGRVTEENYANNTKKINYTYATKQVTVTNTSASQSVVKKFDEYGNVISITDGNSSELKYSYNSTGNVDTVYTLDGEVTTLYDDYARPQQVTDPDLGTITYDYYVSGELKSQTKNNKTTSYTYNKNGQVASITVPEGATSYSYSSTTGLLSFIDGLNNNDVVYAYDDIGRIKSKTEKIDGQNYIFGYTYKDEYSARLASMTYPGNLKINYGYTNGYQDEIRRDSDNSLIWQLQETSPTGQVEKYTNGNNLVTTRTFDYKTGFVDRIQTGSIQDLIYDYDDATGNLTSREDNIRSLTETFGYDDLNRLTSITFNSNTINIGIDENGNIDSKGDLGAYEYNTMQPHAVSKITPSVTYEPETQSATYTSFDKLDTLTQVNKNLIITYGHDFNRRKTVFTDGSSTKTKIFVPGGYEKINNETPDDEEYCYISTPAGITAVYDKTNDEMFYVHPDHLGSIHFITDESGTVEQELSFDAWGRQRNATNWGYSSFPGLKFERGYTFHEHLAEFDLINMNGRVYDPVMARFLSPDPMTQNPGNLQHYNRYAYVLNNPLKYTDPSGYRPYFQRATNEYDEPSESYTPSRWNGSGGSSSTSPYSYDRISEEYTNSYGEPVSWAEVYYNFALPSSYAHINYTEGKGFVGNKSFELKGYNYLIEDKNSPDKWHYWVNYTGNVAQSGGDGFVGTTGIGFSFELAYPKFVTKRLTDYTGVGIDFGIIRDKKGLGFYATTKTTKQTGFACSAQIECFSAFNRPSSPNINIDRSYLVGPGYEFALGIGPAGGSYAVSNAADYGKISTYQMISLSYGLGIDVGRVNWNTNTYVTGN